jgi:hypothetical protein
MKERKHRRPEERAPAWRERDHALFVAYAPTETPRYAIWSSSSTAAAARRWPRRSLPTCSGKPCAATPAATGRPRRRP